MDISIFSIVVKPIFSKYSLTDGNEYDCTFFYISRAYSHFCSSCMLLYVDD